MTGPRPTRFVSDFVVRGRPLSYWHELAATAAAVPDDDPDFAEARTYLGQALGAIREAVGRDGAPGPLAQDLQMGNAMDAAEGQRTSRLATVAGGLMSGASWQSPSLMGGLIAVRGGRSFRQGRQEVIDARKKLHDSHPLLDIGSNVVGSLMTPAPAVGTSVAALREGATIGRPLAAIGRAAARAGGAGALQGGVIGALGSTGDAEDALMAGGAGALLGGVLGAGATAVGSTLTRGAQWLNSRQRAAILDEERKALELSVARQTAEPRVAVAGGNAAAAPYRGPLASSRLAEQDAIAQERRIRTVAMERAAARAPTREAAQDAAAAAQAKAAARAEEIHAARMNSGSTGPETPDAVRLKRLTRERADRAESMRQSIVSRGGSTERKVFTEYNNRPDDMPSGIPPAPSAASRPRPPRGPAASAAREAYVQAEAAAPGTGKAAAARAAAARAEAEAATPVPADAQSLIPSFVPPRVQQLLAKPPTELAQERFLGWLQSANLTPNQQREIIRRLPVAWRDILTPPR